MTCEQKLKKAMKLMDEAGTAIAQELQYMGPEELEQPIPKSHAKVADKIQAFLGKYK